MPTTPTIEAHPTRIANAIRTPDFFRGGNAYFTVSNPHGERYTFRISRAKDSKPEDLRSGMAPRPPLYFAALLTGPQNTDDYTYLGVYDPTTSTIRLTRASKLAETSKPVQVLRWAVRPQTLERLHIGLDPKVEGYAIQHNGRCCRCGRMLTVPESIEAGIGPECATRG